ncbi:CMRF35-like molecule 3 isoform X2 [Scyliorhinus canicula]|uniref:CMRF35-like molecule 3 isoform X2 n=1 Tax=Scyliorhinus canicula TaxID=7830 RepID=UPI0018F30680|nr:CMRF35-like molecule 3 isoform X2 [Scyliorhinus canicula]
MEFIALLILMPLSSLCQLTAPEKVDGEFGGSVTLNCQYDLLYVSHVKQLCRGHDYYECSVVVSTIEPENGRISLTDNKIQGIFSITIDDLMKDDGGRYWCVIILMSLFKIHLKTSIDLEVSEELQWTSTMGPNPRITSDTVTPSSSISPIHIEAELNSHRLWTLFRWLLFAALAVCTVSVTCWTRFAKKSSSPGQQMKG